MAVTESERYELYQVLVEKLGAEGAQTLMEHLPPTGWSDVATKHDFDHQRALFRADLDQHRAETRAQLDQHRAETRAQLDQHRAETRAQLDQHRAETSAELKELRGEIRASELRLETKIERGLRLNALTVIGVNASLLTAAVTVFALLGR
jgi:hypothetical protein